MQIPVSDYVAFVAPFPRRDQVVEGWMSRIRAVDEIFDGIPRVYLNFSSTHPLEDAPNCVMHEPGAVEYFINPTNKMHLQWVETAILESRFVYVQTVHLARYVLEYLSCGKIVTDFHGIVPEEEVMMGCPEVGAFYEGVERAVMSTSKMIVVVTEAMRRHLLAKHPDCAPHVIVLPIVERHKVSLKNKIERSKKQPSRIVYSGGVQAWQNIDLMANLCVNTCLNANYTFLSHDHQRIREIMERAGFSGNAQYLSVGKDELAQRYLEADFGFVLRDDVAVNRVACPTKLSEYLQFGIVPIVKSPNIGDFLAEGYAYVTADEFQEGFIPGVDQVREIINQNSAVLDRMTLRFQTAAARLRRLRLPNMVRSGSLAGLPVQSRTSVFPVRREVYVFGDETHYKADWAISEFDEHTVSWETPVSGRFIRVIPMLADFTATITDIKICATQDSPSEPNIFANTWAQPCGPWHHFREDHPYIDVIFDTSLSVKSVSYRLIFGAIGDASWKQAGLAGSIEAQKKVTTVSVDFGGATITRAVEIELNLAQTS